MIPLYAKMSDIRWTEDLQTVKAIAEFAPTYQSIKKDGIFYGAHIDYNGVIRDGNMRYWIAKQLEYEYLPIDQFFFLGIQNNAGDHLVFGYPELYKKTEGIAYTAHRYINGEVVT